MQKKLIDLMAKHVPISDKEIQLCNKYFEPALFPKNRIIEEENEVPQYLYFVVNGFVRIFHYNDAGEDITTHINCPPGFITAYGSFMAQTKSSENVECVTDCELLKITKHNLDLIIEESASIKNFSIQIFQQSLAYNENRARELAILTAEQRYLKMIDEYPAILQNVPMNCIASFLGMKPESLSRIRKKILHYHQLTPTQPRRSDG